MTDDKTQPSPPEEDALARPGAGEPERTEQLGTGTPGAPGGESSRDDPDAEAKPAPSAAVREAGQKARSETVYCVYCGAPMNRGDVFCHACGWDSRVKPPSPPPSPPRRVEANPSGRSRLTALLLCLLLGWLGAHRFYVGKVGTGLIWLFTLGVFGIGVIYDLVLIATGEFRDDAARRIVRWE